MRLLKPWLITRCICLLIQMRRSLRLSDRSKKWNGRYFPSTRKVRMIAVLTGIPRDGLLADRATSARDTRAGGVVDPARARNSDSRRGTLCTATDGRSGLAGEIHRDYRTFDTRIRTRPRVTSARLREISVATSYRLCLAYARHRTEPQVPDTASRESVVRPLCD